MPVINTDSGAVGWLALHRELLCTVEKSVGETPQEKKPVRRGTSPPHLGGRHKIQVHVSVEAIGTSLDLEPP